MSIRSRIKFLFSSKKQIRSSAIIIFTILVLLVLTVFTPLSEPVQSIQTSFYFVGENIGSIWRKVFASEESIQSKLSLAETRLIELSIDKSHTNELENEVKELRNLLNYRQTISNKSISAKIIARSTNSEDQILIDKGSKDGIRQELAVVVEGGHIIGKIQDVQENSSTVLLLKDKRSKIASKILGAESTLGLVEGNGGFLLKMNFIPQSNTLKIDDMVVTSGLDGHIQKGLVIGVIKEVIRIDTEQFLSAHIEPIVDVRNYSNVLVIDPTAEVVEYDN